MQTIFWNITKLCILMVLTACNANINKQYFVQTTEYINRVAKKLLIVSDESSLNQLNINIIIKNTPKILFISNTSNNTLIVSTELLEYLQDEAELSAILAIFVVTLEQQHFNKLADLAMVDQKIINYMYKAGYDPMAFVELQEEYLVNKNKNYNWLNAVFLYNIGVHTVYNNKKFALLLTKGTERAKERYFSQVKAVLKKLD